MSKVLLALCALALLPGVCSALERTCRACLDDCCQWSHAAIAFARAREAARPPGRAGKEYLERLRNFKEPIPCVDVVAAYRGKWSEEYAECAWKAYDSCLARHCPNRGMHLTPETPTYSMRGCGGLPADAGGV